MSWRFFGPSLLLRVGLRAVSFCMFDFYRNNMPKKLKENNTFCSVVPEKKTIFDMPIVVVFVIPQCRTCLLLIENQVKR